MSKEIAASIARPSEALGEHVSTARGEDSSSRSKLVEPDTPQAPGLEHLTPRQTEVLRLVARGMSNAEIADALFLSRRTVHAHLRSIFHKLEVGNRSAATRYAIQHRLL